MRNSSNTPDWLALHLRICQGDEDAFTQLAKEVRPLLHPWLRRRLPHGDDALIVDSISDALLAYFQAPTRFDVNGCAALPAYLFGIARYRLLHHLRSESRRQRREDIVFLDPENIDLEEPLSLSTHLDIAELDACRERLDELIPHLKPKERVELDLMRDGVQDVEAWARLLPLETLPLPRQRKRIKFEKVRIKRKLLRLVCG
jgi:RNA polymerase sigma factor (sigma-70 family)